MIDVYVNYLKHQIKNLPEVKKSSTLNLDKWNKTSYEELSRTIFDKLERKLSSEVKLKKGSTISSRTLYNIFEFKRKINIPLDKRSLNTLDKLALFADQDGWKGLVSEYESKFASKNGEIPIEEKIKHLILIAKEAEFQAYNELPTIQTDNLKRYFTKKSKALAEIRMDLETACESQLVISNNFNPSSYEILSIAVEESFVKENHFVVTTEEYWVLCWYDKEAKKYVRKDKRLEKHKYLIKYLKKGNRWLIDVNASA